MTENPQRRGVIVGVDGSASSDAAVEWATKDAALHDDPLTLVHVAAPVTATLPKVLHTGDFRRWQESERRAILDDAAMIAEKTAPYDTPRIERRMLIGAAVPSLVDASRDARLVVVGRHGRGRLRHVLGSVGSGLTHHAHGPVVVVDDEYPLLPDCAFAPVLVGVDGSPISEAATAIAFDAASRRGVGLIALLACLDWSGDGFPFDERSALESEGHEVLAERLAGWQEIYPDVTVQRVVVAERAAEHLVEESTHAQLVVVGSHGFGGFTGMLLGSVSTAVLRSTRTPVLIARHA
ncbi:universal stress protein [Mycobacterium hodleri]|uniref:Universal stress protein n=1 Tax=Mycolicibacterium hodleri TaxID=49897 RepID=A0A544W362_9MYCO|nr:universal stress protein [Mycolicibacterium hodleri]TQR86666.1 universal stress protein [Mycolicibacterium hodleri]